MDLIQFMSEQLHRELDGEEVQMLQQLNAQGIAKLNHDAAKGVSPDVTLRELLVVYRARQQRQAAIQQSLSRDCRALIKTQLQLDPFHPAALKTLTADEMIAVSERSRDGGELQNPDSPTERWEQIEELTATYLEEQLANDFKMLTSFGGGRAFQLSRLTATTLPKELALMSSPYSRRRVSNPHLLSSTMVRNKKSLATVGLSPVVTWFDERTENPIQVYVGDPVRDCKPGTIIINEDLTDERPPTTSSTTGDESMMNSIELELPPKVLAKDLGEGEVATEESAKANNEAPEPLGSPPMDDAVADVGTPTKPSALSEQTPVTTPNKGESASSPLPPRPTPRRTNGRRRSSCPGKEDDNGNVTYWKVSFTAEAMLGGSNARRLNSLDPSNVTTIPTTKTAGKNEEENAEADAGTLPHSSNSFSSSTSSARRHSSISSSVGSSASERDLAVNRDRDGEDEQRTKRKSLARLSALRGKMSRLFPCFHSN